MAKYSFSSNPASYLVVLGTSGLRLAPNLDFLPQNQDFFIFFDDFSTFWELLLKISDPGFVAEPLDIHKESRKLKIPNCAKKQLRELKVAARYIGVT